MVKRFVMVRRFVKWLDAPLGEETYGKPCLPRSIPLSLRTITKSPALPAPVSMLLKLRAQIRYGLNELFDRPVLGTFGVVDNSM